MLYVSGQSWLCQCQFMSSFTSKSQLCSQRMMERPWTVPLTGLTAVRLQPAKINSSIICFSERPASKTLLWLVPLWLLTSFVLHQHYCQHNMHLYWSNNTRCTEKEYRNNNRRVWPTPRFNDQYIWQFCDMPIWGFGRKYRLLRVPSIVTHHSEGVKKASTETDREVW